MAVDDESVRLRRQFEDLEHLISVGFWDFELATAELHWSPGLCRIYGVDPVTFEPSYEAWMERIHPEDRPMVERTVQRSVDRLESYRIDHRLYRESDGVLRWTRCHGRVLRGPDGGPAVLSGVSIDVTDEHETAASFRELIVNAAHELRTPAAVIAQAVQALEGQDDETLRNDLHQMLERQAARLRRLTSDLVDLGKIADEASADLREPVVLADVIQAALEAAPPPDGHTVVVEDVEEGLAVLARESLLERVLVNLLTNAFRYGGPTVSISARRNGRRVIVDVADDGEGVPEDARASLFQPFRRGVKRHPEASGLGLAIVEGLMRQMGGSVAFRPGDPGAVFELTLDAAGPDAA